MLGRVRPAQGGGGAVKALAGGAAHAVIEELLVAADVGKGQLLAGQVVEVAALLLAACLAQPTVAVVKIRRGEVIPDAAGGLLPGVFRLGDGPVFTQEAPRVPVEHRADILRVDQHVLSVDGAAAHEAPAVGVQHVLEVLHFRHVGGADGVVARLPEEDGRVVAEGDDDVAHQLHPLIPLAAEVLPLLVAGGLGADHAVAVVGAHVGLVPCHMHEADVVGPAFPDEPGVQVVQPFRHNAAGGPLVGGALGIAPQPYRFFIDGHTPVLVITCLAEAGLNDLLINGLTVPEQRHMHPVERRVMEAPEAHAADLSAGPDDLRAHRIQPGGGYRVLIRRDVMLCGLIPDVGVLRGDADAVLPRLRRGRRDILRLCGKGGDLFILQRPQ